jgi:hypothetical protein
MVDAMPYCYGMSEAKASPPRVAGGRVWVLAATAEYELAASGDERELSTFTGALLAELGKRPRLGLAALLAALDERCELQTPAILGTERAVLRGSVRLPL